jgi:hypothetical protein
MSTSVVAFDLRARPRPGPGGLALAFEACTFALKAVYHQPNSPSDEVYSNSPASSCSSNGTRLSAGPKSMSTMALMTSVAVIDFPDLDRAWSCALSFQSYTVSKRNSAHAAAKLSAYLRIDTFASHTEIADE